MTPEFQTAVGELSGAAAMLLIRIQFSKPAPAHLTDDQRRGWEAAIRWLESSKETENLTAAKQRFDKAMSEEAQNLLKK